jgi:hypothetical protein
VALTMATAPRRSGKPPTAMPSQGLLMLPIMARQYRLPTVMPRRMAMLPPTVMLRRMATRPPTSRRLLMVWGWDFLAVGIAIAIGVSAANGASTLIGVTGGSAKRRKRVSIRRPTWEIVQPPCSSGLDRRWVISASALRHHHLSRQCHRLPRGSGLDHRWAILASVRTATDCCSDARPDRHLRLGNGLSATAHVADAVELS